MKHLFFTLCFSLACLQSMAQNRTYTVLFDFNKYEIPDSAMLALIKMIHSKANEVISIEAHCDSIGDKNYNLKLSLNRAKSIQRLLVSNGIPSQKIKTIVGFGKEKPLNANEDDFQRQLNRRAYVTFTNISSEPIQETTKPVLKEKPITKKAEPISTPLAIENFKLGETLTLENLLFFGGSHRLRPNSIQVIMELATILKNNLNIEIEIHGHVCCTTDEPDGFDWDTGKHNLSSARAEMVFDYLVSMGIAPSRMRHKGFGGTQKINEDERTEKLRRVNRRVEILVTKK